MDLRSKLTADVKKDLHIHTYYSDGTLPPREIVDRWKAAGYEMIAITDHDGIDGSAEVMDYAAEVGIELIPGIEFDSEDPLGKDMHMLGYGMDYESEILRAALDEILRRRSERNEELLRVFNDKGYDITLEDVMRFNGGRFVGKPNFARALTAKGYAPDPQTAFDTIFRDDDIRRIVKRPMSTREIVDVIHGAGGLAVLAHPMEQRHYGESMAAYLPRLTLILETMRSYGIDGIECRHPSANEAQSELLSAYADIHGLMKTCGSDFHTDDKPRDYTRYKRP